MTDKQLKKLSRRELLEMLIIQTRKVEALEQQLQEANDKLADKLLTIENAGSLADAVMQLNGVFEAAQNAAQQYLVNIQHRQAQADRRDADGTEA